MPDASGRSFEHGIAGGLIAGAVVALWFLAVDLVGGDPFRTPATLGAALFEPSADTSPTALIALYTVLHFGVFAALGAFTAVFLRATGLAPGWLLGALFGIVVLNGIHYLGLLGFGEDLLTVLPWPHVVGANLVAGLALMTFLHRAEGAESPLGPGAVRSHPLLAEGLIVGLVGAVAVAVWFFLVDMAAGRPLYTPAALGSALFLGAEGAAEVQRTAPIVIAYSIVHGLAFWGTGVLFVAIARQVERVPRLAYLVLLALILLEAVSFGVLVVFGEWVLGTLSVWLVGVGNLIAVGGMAGWLWRTRPELRERVAREGFASTA